METIKKKIVDTILAKVPIYLNPVDFLHEVLGISKESIYRRIKGEVSFTLEDLVKICSTLSISLDEIIYTNQDKGLSQQPIMFQSRSDKLFDPQRSFLEFLMAYAKNMEMTDKSKNVEIMVAANRLMILTTVSYNHLFKFYYYKWIHQTQQKPLSFCMSDVIISDEIFALQEKLKAFTHSGNHTYILDYFFLENTIREIHYYYKRQLISEEEILFLQKDLYKLIEVIEYRIRQKIEIERAEIEGCASYIYLSTIQIESSGLYCKCEDKESIHLWISYGINIRSDNSRICSTYRSWFNSLKKYSSLISGCNEILQAKFISKQRTCIQNMTNISPYL